MGSPKVKGDCEHNPPSLTLQGASHTGARPDCFWPLDPRWTPAVRPGSLPLLELHLATWEPQPLSWAVRCGKLDQEPQEMSHGPVEQWFPGLALQGVVAKGSQAWRDRLGWETWLLWAARGALAQGC